MDPIWLVVMGVSGCGKSSLGAALAAGFALPLIEGDDFHPASNTEKMRAGIALTDADRAGWLDALADELARRQDGAVLTCSALKRAYRDRLRAAVPSLGFVFMAIEPAAAQARVAARARAHIFPASLVASQFATLEVPVGEAGVLAVPAIEPLERLVAEVRAWVHRPAADPPAAGNA
ncbi:MAG: putative carbohydrate kinase [Variovorax sp.]|nr:putative carbohydrate kinase [Variovorax sp.]